MFGSLPVFQVEITKRKVTLTLTEINSACAMGGYGVERKILSASGGLILTAVLLSSSFITSEADAGGFALREQSAYYQGLSFAGNGTTSNSISSIFWNPATITGARDGLTVEAHNSFIIPRSEINVGAGSTLAAYGDSGDIASDAWVGSSYASYKINDDLYLGIALNAPFGLSTKPEYTWAGQVYNRSSKVFSINANPIIGYKINEMISIAAGVQVQYFDVKLKAASGAAIGAPSNSLEGDDVGFGVTAGVTIKPFKGTEIGLGYRSGVGQNLEGDLYTPTAIGLLPAGTYGIAVDMITPDMVTLSAKQEVTDDIRLLATFEWANWSRLKAPAVELAATGTTITNLEFNYNDGYFLALGGEYDFNDKLTLRAGAAYEWSPIDTEIRSARLPDNNRIWLSAGASYSYNEHLSFDLGYTHIIGSDTDLDVSAGHQDFNGITLVGDVDSSVDILTASVRYTF